MSDPEERNSASVETRLPGQEAIQFSVPWHGPIPRIGEELRLFYGEVSADELAAALAGGNTLPEPGFGTFVVVNVIYTRMPKEQHLVQIVAEHAEGYLDSPYHKEVTQKLRAKGLKIRNERGFIGGPEHAL